MTFAGSNPQISILSTRGAHERRNVSEIIGLKDNLSSIPPVTSEYNWTECEPPSFDEKEKGVEVVTGVSEVVQEEVPTTNVFKRYAERFDAWLASRGLEGHGYVCRIRPTQIFVDRCIRIEPTTEEQRTDTRIFQEFTVWFSANINVQAYALQSTSMLHDGNFSCLNIDSEQLA